MDHFFQAGGFTLLVLIAFFILTVLVRWLR